MTSQTAFVPAPTRYESIYWVFTQLCNDSCAHCYNLSGPRGERLELDECLAIVDNLPDQLDRLILSGGEPLAERKKLYPILEALQSKYRGATQMMLQTNGDLITGDILDELLQRGVTRIDLASIDRYHKHAGERLAKLSELFKSRGMTDENAAPLIEKETYLQKDKLTFGYWGATEEMWLGGNWARGRAMEKNIWKRDGSHNFCAILSGGKGFLGGTELPQEISIQLWKVNPCCPGTKHPMGDARKEKITDILKRVASSPIFQKINEGDPYSMGESIGISADFARTRANALENVCLWCDEFFEKHLPALPAQD
jgi:organic radical activating enzyme